MQEGVDISYTKFHAQTPTDQQSLQPRDAARESALRRLDAPGEWFTMTVDVARAGVYTIDLLYTSNRGGSISLDRNGQPLVPEINIISTQTDRGPRRLRQWHHWNVLTNAAEVTLPKASVF